MKTTRRRSLALFAPLLILMLAMVGLWRDEASNSPTPMGTVEVSDHAEVMKKLTDEPAITEKVKRASARQSLTPAQKADGVLSLTFQFQGQQLVIAGREQVSGSVRQPRFVGGASGIYHRVTDSAGNILFESMSPDPRVMHYDYTDDGRSLRGGVAVTEDTPLHIRLPGGLQGRLEVFLARSAQISPAAQATPENLLAQVDLP